MTGFVVLIITDSDVFAEPFVGNRQEEVLDLAQLPLNCSAIVLTANEAIALGRQIQVVATEAQGELLWYELQATNA